MPKNKLDIQRKFADHFRALGFDLPVDATSTKWHQPVLECQHEFCLLSLDDIIRDTMDVTVELVPSQSCTLYLYDRRSRMLTTRASTNSKRQVDVKFAPGMGIVGRCFSRKIAVHLEKPGENSLFEAKSDGKQNKAADSMLCIPLIVHDRAIGLFQLVNRVVDKKDKLRDLDRYMEGFDNLSFNTVEHLGEPHHENAFNARDVSTLMEYASLVAESIGQALYRHEAKDPSRDKGNSAMDLLNMLNGKLTTSYEFDIPDLPPERKHSIAAESGRRPSTRSPPKSKLLAKARSIVTLPRSPTNGKERFIQAAIKCQACGRGWLVRRHHPLARLRIERLARLELQRTRVLRIQKTYRGRLGRVRVKRIRKARNVIADAVFQYVQRKQDTSVQTKVGSPRTRKLWAQTSSTLLTERTKLKHKKVTNIQKMFRGHKAREEVKEQFGVSNPAKMYRCFVKLQARFKGRLLRKLIHKHTVLQHKATKAAIPAFGVVRMRCQNAEPRVQSKAYPRCHTGMNQYLVAKRGQVPDLGPLFDTLRLHQQLPPPRSPHFVRLPVVHQRPQPQDDEPNVPVAVNTRRLVAAHALATNAPLPQLARRGHSSPARPHDSSPKLRHTYRVDAGTPRRNSTVARHPLNGVSPAANQDTHMYGIQQYPQFRTRAYIAAVGAPTAPAPPTRSRQPSPPHRPFLCLVHHTEDAKREGIRKALEELKSYYCNRVVPGPVNRRKSIKEVMDECSKLKSTKSMAVLVHRVKNARGVDFNATLLVPEIPEEPVSEMDSVDSLALEYRPVTPMLDAIQLIPPEPHFVDIPTVSRLDCIFADGSTSATSPS